MKYSTLWLLLALTSIALEAGHPGLFFFLSFAFGFFAGGLASILGYELVIQCLVAFGATLTAFLYFSWWIRGDQKRHGYRTNVYALHGKIGYVTMQIDPGTFGQVKINGEIWRAKGVQDEILPVGTGVIVCDVQGAHVSVIKKENNV